MSERVEDRPPKPLVWVGSSKRDLMAFPAPVVDSFGFALFLAQIGKRHDRTKVLRGFGTYRRAAEVRRLAREGDVI